MTQYKVFSFLSLATISSLAVVIFILSMNPKRLLTTESTGKALKSYLWLSMFFLLNNSFEIMSGSPAITLFLAKLDYFYVSFLPVVWLRFVVNYTGNKYWANPKRFWPLFLFPGITTLLSLGSDFHQLIWESYDVVQVGTYYVLQAHQYGIWFWLLSLYGNTIFLGGVLILFVTYYKVDSFYRKQTRTIIYGIVVPLFVLYLFVLKVIPGVTKDFSAIAYGISGIVFSYAIRKYTFLDIMPVARSMVVENLRDAVVLVDSENRIVDLNPSTRALFNIPDGSVVGEGFETFFPEWVAIRKEFGNRRSFQKEFLHAHGQNTRNYSLQATLFEKSDGYLVTIRDVTLYKRAQDTLKNYQHKLEDEIAERTAELSLVNATLEERVSDRTRDLTALFDISNASNKFQSMAEFLTACGELVRESLEADLLSILLRNEENSSHESPGFEVFEAKNPDLKGLERLSKRLDYSVIKNALEESLSTELFTLNPRNAALQKVEADEMGPEANQGAWQTYVLAIPLIMQNELLGAIAAVKAEGSPFTEEEVGLGIMLANQVGLGISRYRLQQESERAKLLEEREALAADLHDSVSQSLYGLAAFSDVGGRYLEMNDIPKAKAIMQQINEETRLSLKEFRLFIHNLRPVELAEGGLASALEARLTSVEGRADIRTSLLVDPGFPRLPLKVEENLYYIAQEALNNTMRHSKASEVTISLQQVDGFVRMQIQDNGVGFDPQAQKSGRYGLENIRKRALTVGGNAEISSNPQQGTQISISVPHPN